MSMIMPVTIGRGCTQPNFLFSISNALFALVIIQYKVEPVPVQVALNSPKQAQATLN